MPKHTLFHQTKGRAAPAVDSSTEARQLLLPNIESLLLKESDGGDRKALDTPTAQKAMAKLGEAIDDCAIKWCDRLIEPTTVILADQRGEAIPDLDISKLSPAEQELYHFLEKLDQLSKQLDTKQDEDRTSEEKSLETFLDQLPSL